MPKIATRDKVFYGHFNMPQWLPLLYRLHTLCSMGAFFAERGRQNLVKLVSPTGGGGILFWMRLPGILNPWELLWTEARSLPGNSFYQGRNSSCPPSKHTRKRRLPAQIARNFWICHHNNSGRKHYVRGMTKKLWAVPEELGYHLPNVLTPCQNTFVRHSKQRELKFSPQSQGTKLYATYATVKEAVIQHIQKSYKGGQDVAKSLKDMTKFDLATIKPKRQNSSKSKEEDLTLEQTGMDIKYHEELQHYLDCKKLLEEGMNRAYALIVSNYCTKLMQSRVEEHPEFSTKIEDDPIALLEVIKTLIASLNKSRAISILVARGGQ